MITGIALPEALTKMSQRLGSFLLSAKIYIQIIFATALCCIKVLFLANCANLSRKTANKIISKWAKKLVKYAQIDLKIENPHKVDLSSVQPTILMSNHRSHFDIPIIYNALSNPIRMLAKKELYRIPLFGPAMRACEFPSVDRKNRKQAIRDLERAKNKMKSGVKIWLAPEGTRSCDENLLPFKKGGFIMAIQTQATIIPITIIGTEKVLAPGSIKVNPNEEVRVIIGRPIETKGMNVQDKDALTEKVRHEIEGPLNLS